MTNKQYSQFISFLEGKETGHLEMIPMDTFSKKLLDFAVSIKGYNKYLGKNPREWPDVLRSFYDDEKKFNRDDQPVVGVTWYAACAYCFWLSCLEGTPDSLYRLPTETEWEWAAGGEPDGSVREYPWPKEKGQPTPHFANYGENLGATTPVGRYPQGMTPQGLMDMAGNVWEWMENYSEWDENSFALRGGSWAYGYQDLCCSAYAYDPPDDHWYDRGFRVVRALPSQS